MLKEQHLPWSVGKDLKMSEHGMSTPFHWQNFRTDLKVDFRKVFRPIVFWKVFQNEPELPEVDFRISAEIYE
jgi:hypothetical protein